jgi:Rieske 2Fe-2S family protein
MKKFHPTATTYAQGARTLPGRYYTSPEILVTETERYFLPMWHCVGRASRLTKPGDYFLASVAGESLIIVADDKRIPHAFFNVCRHRGTQICQATSGNAGKVLQCPYHAWTYRTDGSLITAPHMHEVKGFDTKEYGLHTAAIAIWEGFLFVSIAKKPTPFAKEWRVLLDRLSRFDMDKLAIGHRVEYDIRANWKLVFQNYNECLHCPTIHPKLSAVLPYTSGANDLTRGPFLGGYMDIREPNQTATMTGKYCGPLISTSIPAEDLRRAYYYTFMPNMLLSIHPDYVNYYLVEPIDAARTRVTSEWLFPEATLAKKKSRIADAIEFWDMTNRQDWDIIERSQLGISSRRYVPGPYSPRESIPAAWDAEYMRRMKSR